METIFSGDRKSYTVFIDLDHTIISKISGKLLAVNAIKKGFAKPSGILRVLIQYLLYKTGAVDPQAMAGKMISWTKGMHESKMRELCLETAEDLLVPSIYNEAVNEIEMHRNKGAAIVLLSASLIDVCNKISERIRIDEVICTTLESKDGYLTGEAKSGLCFGEEKSKRLRDYCLKNNINASESWYYGDSNSDLPVFYSVGIPVCVNPGRMLRKKAAENGWKILNWTH